MLELNLNQVRRVYVAGNVGQPVVCVQLAVLPSYAVLAESAVTASYQ
jgi:hypothetical protein